MPVIVALGFVGWVLMTMGAMFSGMVMDLFRAGMRMLVGMFMGVCMRMFMCMGRIPMHMLMFMGVRVLMGMFMFVFAVHVTSPFSANQGR